MNISSNKTIHPKRRYLVSSLLALTALFFVSAGCEEYDAPPDARLKQPEGGAFLQDEAIRINFTEPIDTSTLAISIWPTERGTGRIARSPDIQPLIKSCTPSSSSCGDLTLTVDKDGNWAQFTLEGELGIPGMPLIIEVHPGLADAEGNETGVSRFFDFQFRIKECGSDVDVEFDDGLYILVAEVKDPMPATLTLVSHMRTLPDGKFALAGAKGQVISGNNKTDRNPENIRVQDDDTGFALFTPGCVSVQKNGKRLLETDPVDVELPVLGLVIKLTNARIFGEVKRNPETGKDRIDGTLSYEELQIIKESGPIVYDGSSTAAIADFVPENLKPAGHPELCGNLCGAITGICKPPEGFPGEEFCP